MEIVYVLIPLSIVLVTLAIVIFIWATNSGQFEDLDTPAWRILRDDESRRSENKSRDDESRNTENKPRDEATTTRRAQGMNND